MMTSNAEMIEKITALQKANGKAYALSDIAPLVQNYIEDITRQYDEAVSLYEQLKTSGASEAELNDALNKTYTLKYQIAEAQNVRNSLANQAIEALESLKSMQDDFNTFAKQLSDAIVY